MNSILKMNKKGWLRILEAVVSILLIVSFLVIMILRTPEGPNISEGIHETQRIILRQISLNNTLRQEILNKDTTNTVLFIDSMVPSSWNFEVKVCETDESCEMSADVDTDVYADQILISATLTQYSPKKLKFFVWIEQ